MRSDILNIELENGKGQLYDIDELESGDIVMRQESGTIFLVAEESSTPSRGIYSGKYLIVLGRVNASNNDTGSIFYEHDLSRPGDKWTFRKVNAKLVIED